VRRSGARSVATGRGQVNHPAGLRLRARRRGAIRAAPVAGGEPDFCRTGIAPPRQGQRWAISGEVVPSPDRLYQSVNRPEMVKKAAARWEMAMRQRD
jgi:hypothetical protein